MAPERILSREERPMYADRHPHEGPTQPTHSTERAETPHRHGAPVEAGR
jgi:hypothetical protein